MRVMQNKMKSRILSLALTLALVAAMLPAFTLQASAAEAYDSDSLRAAISAATGTAEAPTIIEITNDFSITGGSALTISSGLHVKIQSKDPQNPVTLTRGRGGILINVNGGSLTLENIVIDGNKNAAPYNAPGGSDALVTVGGAFTMQSGAELRNNVNNTVDMGGGVRVQLSGTVNMYGGKISGNECVANGGIGTDGGGVAVDSGGTFNMHDGEISGNTAYTYGGGVFLRSGAIAFNMRGGKISGNTATSGGGAYVTGGAMNMDGGEISGNTATGSNNGGVYKGSATLTLGGTSKIRDNKTNAGVEKNVVLLSSQYVAIGTGSNGAAAPAAGMSVGVTKELAYDGGVFVDSGASAAHLAYFTADNPDHMVTYDSANGRLSIALLALSVTGLSAAPETLPPAGGSSTISITGTLLDGTVHVNAFDGADAIGESVSTTGTAASRQATLTFPENTGEEDKVYTVKVSSDSGANWLTAPTTAVTVLSPSGSSFNVSYDANGGTGTMSPVLVTHGANHEILPNAFSRAGYIFTGWNTAANGSGTAYAADATINNITANITLYAQWAQTIGISAIGGVTAPVPGASPVTAITETEQYTGTVTWTPDHAVFAHGTQYWANITLTPKPGYTLTGVPANFFTVAGAISAVNNVNSGTVSAGFTTTPQTPLEGTVYFSVNSATGEATALLTGGNTGSATGLIYTWSGGATGDGQSQTPPPGTPATCTVTAANMSGSLSAAITVYKVVSGATVSNGTTGWFTIETYYGDAGRFVPCLYDAGNSRGVEFASAVGPVSLITGNTGYMIAATDAVDGVITITATFAAFPAGTWNAGDIAAINKIIDLNGLKWTKARPADGSLLPADWEGAAWSGPESDKRVTALDISRENLVGRLDVSGLSALTDLRCEYNLLTGLNVKDLSSLRELNCWYNLLTELDVSGLSSLLYLFCEGNYLTELDVSGLVALQDLDCRENFLTALDLSGLAALEYLGCESNLLTELNLSGLGALEALYCGENLLTTLTLNASGQSNLARLDCRDNFLTGLDVTECGSTLDLLQVQRNYMPNDGSVIGFTGVWNGTTFVFDPQFTGDPLRFTKDHSFNIPPGPQGKAIKPADVSSGVSGSEPPYRFSIPRGHDWLVIDEDTGLITGTRPMYSDSTGSVVIRVTDDRGWYKEISVSVGAVYNTAPAKDFRLTLSPDYLQLDKGSSAVLPGLTPLAGGAPYSGFVAKPTWRSSNEDVAIIDDGMVKAVGAGSCYITALTTVDGWDYSASALVDVAGEVDGSPGKRDIVKARLSQTSVTVNTLSSIGAKVGLVYETVPVIGAFSAGGAVTAMAGPAAMHGYSVNLLSDKGVALSPALEAEILGYFDVTMIDDRTIGIVRKAGGVNFSKIKASYKFRVELEHETNGHKVTIPEVLTVKTTKKAPAIKAGAHKFNTFIDDHTLPLRLTSTSGKVTGVMLNGGKAQHALVSGGKISLDHGAMTLTLDTGHYNSLKQKPKSVKMQLLVTVEGFDPVPYTLSVSAARSLPALKLSAKTVSFIRDPGLSQGAELRLAPKSGKTPLPALGVTDVVLDDKVFEIRDFDLFDGSFTLAVQPGETPVAKTLTLQVSLNGTSQTVPLTLKTSLYSATKVPAIKASKKSVTLNPALGPGNDEVLISLTPTPGDLNLVSLKNNISLKQGKNDAAGALDVGVFSDGRTVVIKTNDSTEHGKTYTVTLATTEVFGAAGKKKPAQITITVKTPKVGAASNVTATIAVKGKLNAADPGSFIMITPKFKNYNGMVNASSFTVTATDSRKNVIPGADEWFTVNDASNGSFTLGFDNASWAQGLIKPGYKYTIMLERDPDAIGCGSKYLSKDVSKAFTAAQGKVKFSQSAKTVTLFKGNPHSSSIVTINAAGSPLPHNARVVINNAASSKYDILPLGGGQFAICFKGYEPATKAATVKLNIYLEGNHEPANGAVGAKANGSVSVKVNLK